VSTPVDRFLAVSRARLAPRTVESYRRDLEDFEAKLDADAACASREQIEEYLAQLRAVGRAGSTIARRLAAREGRPIHVPREPTPGTATDIDDSDPASRLP